MRSLWHFVVRLACIVEPELSGLTEDQGPPPPPRTGDRPPMTQQSRVSFADGTTFEREKTGKMFVFHTDSCLVIFCGFSIKDRTCWFPAGHTTCYVLVVL